MQTEAEVTKDLKTIYRMIDEELEYTEPGESESTRLRDLRNSTYDLERVLEMEKEEVIK